MAMLHAPCDEAHVAAAHASAIWRRGQERTKDGQSSHGRFHFECRAASLQLHFKKATSPLASDCHASRDHVVTICCILSSSDI